MPVGQAPVAGGIVEGHGIGEALEETRDGLLGLQLTVLQQLHVGGVQLAGTLEQGAQAGARMHLGLLEAPESPVGESAAVGGHPPQLESAVVVDICTQVVSQPLQLPLVGLAVEPALLPGQAAHQAGQLLPRPRRIPLQLLEVAGDLLRRTQLPQALLQRLGIAGEISQYL